MTPSDFVIDVADVVKRYAGRQGGVEALKGVSLQVPRGEIFGLLGPNGAGKSTLVKILTTIIRPSRCEGTLLGEPVGSKAVLKKVGYLPEHVRFPDYLTGRQVIEYAGGLAGVDSGVLKSRSEKLLELVGMSQSGRSGAGAGRTMGTYSKGMKQRVGIAQALVNDPDLVFLDEPTDGVDPEGRHDIRELILAMKAEGKTVFINSHLLGELEQVADSVAILSQGEVIRQGSVEELTQQGRQFVIRTEGPVPPWFREKVPDSLSVDFEVKGNRVTVNTESAEGAQGVIDALRAEGVVIKEMKEGRMSLEELFLTTVKASEDTVERGAQR